MLFNLNAKNCVFLKGLVKNLQRNWVFTTNSHFLTHKSLQPNGVNLWYFKFRLFDLTELIVWNIKGLGE